MKNGNKETRTKTLNIQTFDLTTSSYENKSKHAKNNFSNKENQKLIGDERAKISQLAQISQTRPNQPNTK